MTLKVPTVTLHLQKAHEFCEKGLKSKDALHVACAIVAGCDCFVTTDETILKKLYGFKDIMVLDPTSLVRSIAIECVFSGKI